MILCYEISYLFIALGVICLIICCLTSAAFCWAKKSALFVLLLSLSSALPSSVHVSTSGDHLMTKLLCPPVSIPLIRTSIPLIRTPTSLYPVLCIFSHLVPPPCLWSSHLSFIRHFRGFQENCDVIHV